MTRRGERFLIGPERSLLDCLRQLDVTGLGYLVVVKDGKVIGGVSDGDIRRGLISGCSLEDPISSVANPAPVTATPEMTRAELLELARRRGVDPIPVISRTGEFQDIFTVHELLELQVLPNRAVIMAGGLGLRLRPLTNTIPKPLLPLGDRPIIEHVLSHLSAAGIRRCTVTVNYMKEMFPQMLGDGSRLGIELDYVEEAQRLGTIGALGLIDSSKIEHPLIVTNGDVLTGIDIRKLLAEHEATGAVVTMCLKPYQQDVPYGVVAVDGEKIVKLEEKPSYRHLISAGVYCISPEVIRAIDYNCYLDAPQLIESFLKAGRTVSAFVFQEYWRDIGTMEDYYIAQTEFARGISLSK